MLFSLLFHSGGVQFRMVGPFCLLTKRESSDHRARMRIVFTKGNWFLLGTEHLIYNKAICKSQISRWVCTQLSAAKSLIIYLLFLYVVFQVVTNRDTMETLLCIAFVFEVSTSEHGAQHHIYRLLNWPPPPPPSSPSSSSRPAHAPHSTAHIDVVPLLIRRHTIIVFFIIRLIPPSPIMHFYPPFVSRSLVRIVNNQAHNTVCVLFTLRISKSLC